MMNSIGDTVKISNNLIINKITSIEKIKTAKGRINFDEILEKIYKPFGFDLDSFENVIIPKLRSIEQKSCYEIYNKWLEATKTNITPSDNPLVLLYKEYTLNGHSTMRDCYHNDTYNNDLSNNEKIIENSKRWSQENIDGWIKDIKNNKYSRYPINWYLDSASVYYATKYYNIKGMKGAVIGSINPWVESMCLANGASKLITIDYQHIKIGHKDITFLDAFDLVRAREKYYDTFDFIASYSSIEHAGLGRYGDPIDPMGDIKEMQKLKCMLKPGGLFFLGVPTGQDDFGYNCHRTYGRIRLPLMFAGFELLNVFYMEPKPIELKAELFEDYHNGNPLTHFVYVLEKTK